MASSRHSPADSEKETTLCTTLDVVGADTLVAAVDQLLGPITGVAKQG
jgi:hypothetical protein